MSISRNHLDRTFLIDLRPQRTNYIDCCRKQTHYRMSVQIRGRDQIRLPGPCLF